MSNFVTRLLGSAAYSFDVQLLPTSRLTSLPSSALVSACSKHKPMCEYHRSFLKRTLFNFDYSNDGVLHFCHTSCVSIVSGLPLLQLLIVESVADSVRWRNCRGLP